MLAEWLNLPGVDRPIYSTMEDKPGMAELIADFVDDALRHAQHIDLALKKEDLDGMRELCLELTGLGVGFGFDSVTEAARDALTAMDLSHEEKDAVGPLRRLAAICHRLRCGSSVRPPGNEWSESA